MNEQSIWMEAAGWSYSGYGELIRNASHEDKVRMLQELDAFYQKTKAEHEAAMQAAESLKTMRGLCVNAFMQFAQIEQTNVLTFRNGDDIVIVQPNREKDVIDYERYPANFLSE